MVIYRSVRQEAKAEKPSSIDELHVMLMNMLVDRLQLKFHREKREMPIYAVTVDKSGAKLKQHDAANAGDLWIDQTMEKIPPREDGSDCGDHGIFRVPLVPGLG